MPFAGGDGASLVDRIPPELWRSKTLRTGDQGEYNAPKFTAIAGLSALAGKF